MLLRGLHWWVLQENVKRHLHLSCRDCGTCCVSGSNGFSTLENDVSDEEKLNDGEGNETLCDSSIFSSSTTRKKIVKRNLWIKDNALHHRYACPAPSDLQHVVLLNDLSGCQWYNNLWMGRGRWDVPGSRLSRSRSRSLPRLSRSRS